MHVVINNENMESADEDAAAAFQYSSH